MQVEDLQVEDRHEPVITESRVINRDVVSPPSDALRSVQLVKNYGRRRVVDDVSLHVNKGEVVGLLGANGAGKTTTFYMIVGLERPDGGSVLLGDRDLTRLPMYLRARLGIGYLAAGAFSISKDDCGPKHPRGPGDDGTAPARTVETDSRSCWKSLESLTFAILGEMLCLVANAGAPKLPAHWQRNRSTFCSMNHLPVSIRKPLTTFKMSYFICVIAGSAFSLPITMFVKL